MVVERREGWVVWNTRPRSTTCRIIPCPSFLERCPKVSHRHTNQTQVDDIRRNCDPMESSHFLVVDEGVYQGHGNDGNIIFKKIGQGCSDHDITRYYCTKLLHTYYQCLKTCSKSYAMNQPEETIHSSGIEQARNYRNAYPLDF